MPRSLRGERTIDNPPQKAAAQRNSPATNHLAGNQPLFFRIAPGSHGTLATPRQRAGTSVRVAAQSLGGMQKEALVVSSHGSAIWRLASDEGAYLAGHDEAPCPLSFMTAGMVASFMEEARMLARQRSIIIKAMRLELDNFYTMKGSALAGTMIGGARGVELGAWIDADADKPALRALIADAVAASPVHSLIVDPVPGCFTLTHNARPLSPDRVVACAEPAPPDPAASFGDLKAAPGKWGDIIVKGGLTPKTSESVTNANDSLEEEQNRLLHLRGTCTLRSDGLKVIDQQMFNPRGSMFQFLSEEGTGDGTPGRAPDALSLVAAGIAFCFMTQLGRYAAISKKRLGEHSVVQDILFPPSGSARSARALPVETHLLIHSDEDDGFARTALDMSEQTCFLHALCRSRVGVKMQVSRTDSTVTPPAN